MEAEFLKKELNMAKTEIVKLETKLRDHERSLSLYSARVKAFEDREQAETSTKYFGSSNPKPQHESHCCHHVCQNSNTHSSLSPGVLQNQIDGIKRDLEEIKSTLLEKSKTSVTHAAYTSQVTSSASNTLPTSNTSSPSSACHPPYPPEASGANNTKHTPGTSHQTCKEKLDPLDVSMSSVEEFLPEIDHAANFLNSSAPTNQLIQLMHHQ